MPLLSAPCSSTFSPLILVAADPFVPLISHSLTLSRFATHSPCYFTQVREARSKSPRSTVVASSVPCVPGWPISDYEHSCSLLLLLLPLVLFVLRACNANIRTQVHRITHLHAYGRSSVVCMYDDILFCHCMKTGREWSQLACTTSCYCSAVQDRHTRLLLPAFLPFSPFYTLHISPPPPPLPLPTLPLFILTAAASQPVTSTSLDCI